MSQLPQQRTAIDWRMVLACLAVVIAIIVSLLVPAPSPHATAVFASTKQAVGMSDVVYSKPVNGPNGTMLNLTRLDANGYETPIGSPDIGAAYPQVSPDGKSIVFVRNDYLHWALSIIDIDGSHLRALPVDMQHGQIERPHWSPDGNWIAYISHTVGIDGTMQHAELMRMPSDGSAPPSLIISDSRIYSGLSWSPDGQRIVFSGCLENQVDYQPQLYIINVDSTNLHRADSTNYNDNQLEPAWSPDGNTIYSSNAMNSRVIVKSVSTDEFASSDGIEQVINHNHVIGQELLLSMSGHVLLYANWHLLLTTFDTTSNSPPSVRPFDMGAGGTPSFVGQPQPSITLNAASSSDPFLARYMTINLSRANVSMFQYGWSLSASRPPAGTLQVSPSASTQARLDFRSSTPNKIWYVWVRPIFSDGSNGLWAPPVAVRTPAAPLWVGMGDSYSSGHHQDFDEPLCPRLADVGSDVKGKTIAKLCNNGHGPSDLVPNSVPYSWLSQAVAKVNADEALPPAWMVTLRLLAKSGASSTTIRDKQAPIMRHLLSARADSWNIVSLTGGADDIDFGSPLSNFYSKHWTGLLQPWGVQHHSDCPDIQPVYNRAVAATPTIITNLLSVITTAVESSPSTRIVNVGYGYAVDQNNPCFSDDDTTNSVGVKTLIDLLNGDHRIIVGPNVGYIDLTADTSLGLNPVEDGYLQLTRLYGYPHPSANGQSRIASAAADLVRTMS